MDKPTEDNLGVSLPGAGETELTIFEELNRNLTNRPLYFNRLATTAKHNKNEQEGLHAHNNTFKDDSDIDDECQVLDDHPTASTIFIRSSSDVEADRTHASDVIESTPAETIDSIATVTCNSTASDDCSTDDLCQLAAVTKHNELEVSFISGDVSVVGISNEIFVDESDDHIETVSADQDNHSVVSDNKKVEKSPPDELLSDREISKRFLQNLLLTEEQDLKQNKRENLVKCISSKTDDNSGKNLNRFTDVTTGGELEDKQLLLIDSVTSEFSPEPQIFLSPPSVEPQQQLQSTQSAELEQTGLNLAQTTDRQWCVEVKREAATEASTTQQKEPPVNFSDNSLGLVLVKSRDLVDENTEAITANADHLITNNEETSLCPDDVQQVLNVVEDDAPITSIPHEKEESDFSNTQKVEISDLDKYLEDEEDKDDITDLSLVTPNLSDKFQHYNLDTVSLPCSLRDRERTPPPVPPETYRWEDLRRAREQGGYPWTHLYKPPLGPDEEPDFRRRRVSVPAKQVYREFELRSAQSVSPTSLRRRIIEDEQRNCAAADDDDVTNESEPKNADNTINKSATDSIENPSARRKFLKNILKPFKRTREFQSPDFLKPLRRIGEAAKNPDFFKSLKRSKKGAKADVDKSLDSPDSVIGEKQVEAYEESKASIVVDTENQVPFVPPIEDKETSTTAVTEKVASIVAQIEEETSPAVNVIETEELAAPDFIEDSPVSIIIKSEAVVYLPEVKTEEGASKAVTEIEEIAETLSAEASVKEADFSNIAEPEERIPSVSCEIDTEENTVVVVTEELVTKPEEQVLSTTDENHSSIETDANSETEAIDDSIKTITVETATPAKVEAQQLKSPSVTKSRSLKERCQPFVTKVLTMADKQIEKANKKLKRVPLKKEEKLVIGEEVVLKLRESPKAERREIAAYIEKRDSDDIVEIVPLDESPTETRKKREIELSNDKANRSSIVVPDEIIELPDAEEEETEPAVEETTNNDAPTKKVRRQAEHIYEEIPDLPEGEKKKDGSTLSLHDIQEVLGHEGYKIALKIQDESVLKDVEQQQLEKAISESLEDDRNKSVGLLAPISSIDSTSSDEDHRADLSTVLEESDVASSDFPMDEPPSQQSNVTTIATTQEVDDKKDELEVRSILKRDPSPDPVKKVTFSSSTEEVSHREDVELPEHVTAGRWSKISDHEYEPIGEPLDTTPATTLYNTSAMTSDVSQTLPEQDAVPTHNLSTYGDTNGGITESTPYIETLALPTEESQEKSAQEIQDELEGMYFTKSRSNLPRKSLAESLQEASAIEFNEPIQAQSKRGFMASAQESGRNFNTKLKSGAATVGAKIRNIRPRRASKPEESPSRSVAHESSRASNETPISESLTRSAAHESSHASNETPPSESLPQVLVHERSRASNETPPSESPKPKARRFRTPEFSKLKILKMPTMKRPQFKRPNFNRPSMKRPSMPQMKRPSMPSMPQIKRPSMPSMPKMPTFKKPEMPKMPNRPRFSKPEIPKFNFAERFSSLRLRRSKSLKEPAVSIGTTSIGTSDRPNIRKKRFDFRRYPNIFDRMRGSISSKRTVSTDESPVRLEPLQFSTFPRMKKKVDTSSEDWDNKMSDLGDDESGKYQKYQSDTLPVMQEPDIVMLEASGGAITEELKQQMDYDKENREIHEISKAREDEFKHRKPVPRQESDVQSEEGKESNWTESAEKIQIDEADLSERYEYDGAEVKDKDRESNTHTNQETQSSGSSSNRRRKGVIEEIDDDEFYLRKKGISQDNIEIGQYISSAIREGLETPVNTLAQMGRYDSYNYDDENDHGSSQADFGYDVPPSKPRRVKDYDRSIDDEEIERQILEEELAFAKEEYDNYNKKFQPSKPIRKTKKQYSDESQEEIPDDYYRPYDERIVYEIERKLAEEPKQEAVRYVYDADEFEYEEEEEEAEKPRYVTQPTPPKAPKRRKKVAPKEPIDQPRMDIDEYQRDPDSYASDLPNFEYRAEHEYEKPSSVLPPPVRKPRRRSRSRSQTSRLTIDDAESLVSDIQPAPEVKYTIEMHDTNGYAVVKKDPPPRPPAPARHRKSSERQFHTLPHTKTTDVGDNDEEMAPPRPIRNYSTIGPSKPPRNKSSSSLDRERLNLGSASDFTQYEEIDDVDLGREHQKLQSGEVLNKMKYRPLPPPPRPPREKRSKKSTSTEPNDDDKKDDKPDQDGGGERMIAEFDIDRYLAEHKIEEVDMCTQTDPLPDDYVEEYDISAELRSAAQNSKTLEDILKEEQQAELERARQLADEQSLTRGIQKFRDANQRSYSERSKHSDRPKTPSSRPSSRPGSRPLTPSALIIERKISSPTIEINGTSREIITEAQLIVQPVPVEEAPCVRQIASNDPPWASAYSRRYDLPDLSTPLDDDSEVKQTARDSLERLLQQERMSSGAISESQLRELTPESKVESEDVQETEEEPLEEEIEPIEEGEEEEEPSIHQETDKKVPSPIPLTRQQIDDQIEFDEDYEEQSEVPEEFHVLADPTEEELPPAIPPKPEHTTATKTAEPKESKKTPMPPPRRRSSSGTEQITDLDDVASPQLESIRELQVIPDPPTEMVLPTRLTLTELDVDRLNVGALQAGSIFVSELQGMSIRTEDLECKSGNLIVKGIELPLGFIEELVERVRTSEREEMSQQRQTESEMPQPTETKVEESLKVTTTEEQKPVDKTKSTSTETEKVPARPPPPQMFYPPDYPYSMPPPSFFQLRNYPEEEVHPPSSHRRRRLTRRQESTSEEEYQRERRRSRQGTRSPEPTVTELGGQLARACTNAASRLARQFFATVRGQSKEPREMHIGLIILIVVVALLMMLGMSRSSAIHHHHWDYFNPPDHEGRL